MELEYYKPAQYKKPKYYDCPYNEACRCRYKVCYRCGWNPKVQEIRETRMKIKSEVKGDG